METLGWRVCSVHGFIILKLHLFEVKISKASNESLGIGKKLQVFTIHGAGKHKSVYLIRVQIEKLLFQLTRLYLYLIGILRQFIDVISLRQGIGHRIIIPH